MNDPCNPRLVRRFRRPATRAEVRQRIHQLHILDQLETALDQLHDMYMNGDPGASEDQL